MNTASTFKWIVTLYSGLNSLQAGPKFYMFLWFKKAGLLYLTPTEILTLEYIFGNSEQIKWRLLF